MELRHYYTVLRRRIWIIVLLAAVAVGGVVYQIKGLSPKYEAEVNMLVTPRFMTPTAFEDTGPSAFPGAYRETVLTNITLLIKSREVLERAAPKVGATGAEDLRGRVEVSGVRESDFLLIKAKHDLPERAALIANTLAQEFVDFYEEINRAEATGSQKFIEGELRRAQDRLRDAERALLDFKGRTGAVGLTQEVSSMVQQSLEMQAAYENALLEERLARTRVEAIQARLRSQNDTRLAAVSIATNPVVGQLRTHLTQLELELASLRQVNTDQHPKVKELVGQIADARQRLSEEAARVIRDESLGVSPIREQLVREMVTGEMDAVVARARSGGIIRILDGIQSRLKNLPQNELTLARLQRNLRIAEEMYVRLSSLHQEAVIRQSKAGSSGQAAIVFVDLAKVPDQPVSNQLPFKAGLAGLLGLVLGAAFALLLDGMDDRIRSPRQAEGAYGVPVLAAIPTISPASHRHLTVKPGVAGLLIPSILVLVGIGAGVALSTRPIASMHHTIIRQALAFIQMLPSIP